MAAMMGRETRPTNGLDHERLSPCVCRTLRMVSRAAPVHLGLRWVRLLPSEVDRPAALLGQGAEHRSAHRVEYLRLLPQRVDRRPSLAKPSRGHPPWSSPSPAHLHANGRLPSQSATPPERARPPTLI